MLEIGDTYGQTFTFMASGVLTTPTSIVCTLTLPDGTAGSPVVTTLSTGVVQVTYYPIVQLGMHSVSIAGLVGVYPIAQGDKFNVESSASFLLPLADARTAIGLPTSNTTQDEALRTVMAGATPVMEDLIGPCVSSSRTETYDGGRTTIALLYSPVLSVTSIIEAAGSNYVRTLTAQNIFSGSGSGDAYGYQIDLNSGVITRLASGVPIRFLGGVRNVQVVYVTGRVLKGNQILAARRLIRHLWQTEQQGFRPQMGAPDTTMGTTPSGFAVPRAVIELCAGDTRPPGIG